MGKETQNDDKWHVVILHSDSQYDLAIAVRDSISDIDPGVRAEVFADLFDLGTIHTNIFDEVIENSSILMFFRSEEFFSEKLNNFGLSGALEDRIEHAENRRHYTIVPLDIEKRTKIPGKSSINQLCGLTVTADGDIKGRNQQMVRRLLARACIASTTPCVTGRDRRMFEKTIEEDRSRQQKEISALVPDAPVIETRKATGKRTCNDPTVTADSKNPAGTLRSASQSESDRRVGKDWPVLEDDCMPLLVLTRGTLPVENDPHSCPIGNQSETGPRDKTPAMSVNPESSCALSASPPGASPPTGDVAESGNKNCGDGADSSQLPSSVIPDNQSLSYHSVSSQYDATEPRKAVCDEQSSQTHGQQAASHNLFHEIRQGDKAQSEQHVPDSALRQYWNQTGARPKTHMNCPASSLPGEQRKEQLPVTTGQDLIHTVRQTPPERSPTLRNFDSVAPRASLNLQNHDGTMAGSFDTELEKSVQNLRDTSLTPPPFTGPHGDHFNGQEFPHHSPSQLPGNYVSAYQLPQDLEQDGLEIRSQNSDTSKERLEEANVNNSHRSSFSPAFHLTRSAGNSPGGRPQWHQHAQRSSRHQQEQVPQHQEEQRQHHKQQQDELEQLAPPGEAPQAQEGLAELGSGMAAAHLPLAYRSPSTNTTDSGKGTMN